MTEVIDNTQTTALPPTPPPQDIHAHHSNGKRFKDLPLAEQLLIAKRAYDNTMLNPQISSAMLPFGYDNDKMAVFKELYDQAIIAHNAQVKEYGEKSEAYADFEKFFAVAKYQYSTLRKLLQVALKTDREKLDQLKINDAKKKSVSGLLDQMQVCYSNILTDRIVLEKLAKIGTNELTLQGYRSNYIAAQDAYRIFFKENSEAINATRVRDEKIDALCDFLSDFFILAQIAFANQPDLFKQIS